MTQTQEQTETPDWTAEEEQMCAKILNEINKGETKLYELR